MHTFKTSVLILIFSLLGLPALSEEQQLQEEEEEQSLGAYWGALIGGMVGAFIGDDGKAQAINAAIGAAIGAGAGLLLDKTVGQQANQKIESESERAERIIREMRATNQQLKEDVRYLRGQKQVLQQRLAHAEQSLAQLISELEISQRHYRNSQQKNKSIDLLQWQVRVAKLKQEKYELESNIEDLKAQLIHD